MAERSRVQMVETKVKKCTKIERALALVALLLWDLIFCWALYDKLSEIEDVQERNATNYLRL